MRRTHCNFTPSIAFLFIPAMIIYFNLAEAAGPRRKEKKTQKHFGLADHFVFSASLCKCQVIHKWFTKCWLCRNQIRGQFQAPQGSTRSKSQGWICRALPSSCTLQVPGPAALLTRTLGSSHVPLPDSWHPPRKWVQLLDFAVPSSKGLSSGKEMLLT